MLQLAHRTSAPRSASVSARTAVWMVMWSEPVIRWPFSGCAFRYSRRTAMSPGISFSASSISLRPHSARERSFTRNSNGAAAFEGFCWAVCFAGFLAAMGCLLAGEVVEGGSGAAPCPPRGRDEQGGPLRAGGRRERAEGGIGEPGALERGRERRRLEAGVRLAEAAEELLVGVARVIDDH